MRIRYSLERVDSPGARRDLAPGRYVLGRDPSCDVVIAADGISRRHAELEVLEDRGIAIRDLGSRNGTRVNDQPIRAGAWSGDVVLRLAATRLVLRERSPGLDEIAASHGGAVPSSPTESADRPVQPTNLVTLGRQLAAIARDTLGGTSSPRTPGVDELLARWREVLACSAIRLVRRDGGAVIAAAGNVEDHGVVVAEDEQVLVEVVGAEPLARAALADLARALLVFGIPMLATGPPSARLARSVVPAGPVASANPAMRETTERLARVAAAPISILLLGETGVGKDVLARFIHSSSPRHEGPYLAINCAALPRDLLEAELFGVERGAATGVEARSGLFERASGGTLFLDEIGDTGADLQVRLLRALEDGSVHRIGGQRAVPIDVRVIAATNRDLRKEIEAGRFRLDLFHRLAGFVAAVPPLRARREDIVPLVLHFYRSMLQAIGRSSPGITSAALAALASWSWPGNIRELRQVVEGAVALLDDGEALDLMHLPPEIAGDAPRRDDLTLERRLFAAERDALVTALAAAGGQHARAWRLLGVGKTSFYKKLREHELMRGDDCNG
jgi:transcriptional regulator with AAA-type ATPase domain/pSer/pThr/pTyr-binding forkhead associated (FHA) protein